MKYLLLSAMILQFLGFRLTGQADPDSLFSAAGSRASEKKYTEALLLARKALALGPERSDVLIFMANVHAWQHDFDSSKYYIGRARELDPENPDMYDSWLNMLLWNSEYEDLLKTIDYASVHNYKNDYNILTKKLLAFKNLKKYSDAIDLFKDNKYSRFQDSILVKSIYRDMLLLYKENFVTITYSSDYVSKRNQFQHLASVDYGHKSEVNTYLVRLNYANRFKSNDVQVESDFYHTRKNSSYFYLNYGYSFRHSVFPQHRAGAEYYFHLNKEFEASIGGRYLYFPELPAGILTFSISRYYRSMMFSLRPYLASGKSGNSFALSAGVRKYDNMPLAYWNFEATYGNSPDERFITEPSGGYLKLNSYRFRIARNFVVHTSDEIKLVMGYAYDETSNNNYFSRYTLELFYRFRL